MGFTGVCSAVWEFWIDRGGTFTDVIAKDPSGILHNTKVLSSDEAPLLGIRKILRLKETDPIPLIRLHMGTTLATNALLERKGRSHALLVTRGFKDLMKIGTQQRPDLFALSIATREVLPERIVEVSERLSETGECLQKPDLEEVEETLKALYADGIRSLAISLMHAVINPEHELQILTCATEIGFTHISCSHSVCPEIGYTARTETTCIDAYLTPVLTNYLNVLQQQLPGSSLAMMQSSGGLIQADLFRGHNSIVSGPAAGVIATARIAALLQKPRMIGFDMGGTSTDVSRVDGEPERIYESTFDGLHIKAPLIALETIAAGGGSICRYQGGRFLVGPDSAGSHPGPLCYGILHDDGTQAASALTITDVNLFLGKLDHENFPFPLQEAPVIDALEAIQQQLADDGFSRSLQEIAEGFLEILTVKMAEAVKQITLSKGHDVTQYALCAFGGAGGQHACALARILGIKEVISHPFAGIFSAYGIGLADTRWEASFPVQDVCLDARTTEVLCNDIDAAITEGRQILSTEETPELQVRVYLDCRYAGTLTPLSIELVEGIDSIETFETLHQQRFGYRKQGTSIEVLQGRVSLILPSAESADAMKQQPEEARSSARTKRIWIHGEEIDCPCLHREALTVYTTYTGPLLILDPSGTLLLEPGFTAQKDHYGILHMKSSEDLQSSQKHLADTDVDPVTLESFHQLFISIAEQMGLVLQRTAVSTNVKERLDFSCALFDCSGALIANAPHMPVHLGAMGESVRAVVQHAGTISDGDVFAINHPERGGSHLPDITLVSPVFIDDELCFYVANRAHHADVGGMSPGSMPAQSRTLAEEGIVLDCVTIVRNNRFQEDQFTTHFLEAPYPVRAPQDSKADLEAQIAANQSGMLQLARLVHDQGKERVMHYMQFIKENAAFHVSQALSRFPDGIYSYQDALDDGSVIGVDIHIKGGEARIDFSSCSKQHPFNLNAPSSVLRAATLYVLRCIINEAVPLNEGCLEPITLIIPEKSIVSPASGAAVAGGNVETSQRIVDVLLAAFGVAAASQGTMNNITFGNEHHATYETICGGAGATADAPGRDAVHTHMTNTRITDPEVLELRHPVRLKEFSIREGSGGAGLQRGGHGAIRQYEFLEPCEVSLLTERRDRQPFGLNGGSPGAFGENWHIQSDGKRTKLPGKIQIHVNNGDEIRILTPGGGGFGCSQKD